MKYTLLDLTQTILSSMDSDEVNSINDTVESQQVAKVIRTAYFSLINRAILPEHYSLVNLTPTANPGQPVIMTIPSNVDKIKYVKYDQATSTDTQSQFREVCFKPLDDYLSDMYYLDDSIPDTNSFTMSINGNLVKIIYKNNQAPLYYTTFDDSTLIFSSYDAAVDSTLQSSKSLAYARLTIPWTMDDTFTPDLDDLQFELLLNEAKSLAWAELKQSPHQKAEQYAKRGWNQVQKNKFAAGPVSDFDQLPSFGRKIGRY